MSRTIALRSLFAAVLALGVSTLSSAQQYPDYGQYQYVPYGPVKQTPDWQWFAPVTATSLTEGPQENEGYFFGYERLNWYVGKPDRAPVGNAANTPQFAYFSHALTYTYNAATQADRTPIAGAGFFLGVGDGTAITNSIDSATDTVSGYGNRWEFGYVEDRVGWMAGVLEGFKSGERHVYGADSFRLRALAAAQGLDGVDGISFLDPLASADDPTNPVAAPGLPPVAPVNGIQGLLAIDGFLGVHMLFQDPNNLLFGFIDADADGLPDDLNVDGLINALDLTRLAVVFDEVHVRSQSELNGVEVMAIRRKLPTFHRTFAEAYLGVRYLEYEDDFAMAGLGGILADTRIFQAVDNRMVGPQIGFRWSRHSGRWNFGLQGRGLFAANFGTIKQHGEIGTLLTTGLPGVPARLAPTIVYHTENYERFSPVGDFRAEMGVQLTRGVRAKVGWNGMIVGGITRASNSIRYRLPTLGIQQQTEEVFVQGVNFGLELNR